MDLQTRLKRLRFRAWHRGTREADLLVGGFFDSGADGWCASEADWFEKLLEEQDVDILAWAFATCEPPAHLAGPLMDRLRLLAFVPPRR